MAGQRQWLGKGLPIAGGVGAAETPHFSLQAYAKAMAWQVMNLPLVNAVDARAEHPTAGTGHAAVLASQSNGQDLVAQFPGLRLQVKRHKDSGRKRLGHGLLRHKPT